MKEKKNCSEYELLKEILSRNPDFLDKYVRENLSEKEIHKLTKLQKNKNQIHSKSDKLSLKECFKIPLQDKDHESDNCMGIMIMFCSNYIFF